MAKAIEMIGITKVFPGVLANDRIDFEAEEGEIHALLGENGAGKSTLMSILFGLYAADEGVIRIRGREARLRGPNSAAAFKIGMVHQHFKLVHPFTVAENIALGIEPRGRLGCLNLKQAEDRVQALSERYGFAVDPRARIETMSVGMQQRVEILKILYRDADILIFDEPSAVLTPREVEELLEIFRLLKREGKTIIFITHKLKEIQAVADRCTILRRGKRICTVRIAGGGASEEELAALMVGRAVSFRVEKRPAEPGPVVLCIENLTVMGARGVPAVRNLSLDVRAGEILGIAGVDGNGQSELTAAIAGLEPVKQGRILLEGRDIAHEGVRSRIDRGIGFVPEDRHKHGLVLDFRIDENLILKTAAQKRFSTPLGFLRFPAIRSHAEAQIAAFDIRAGAGPASPARGLSGGNQQKLVIAREIDLSPRLLIAAQPTRGLDVGAIEYIHRRIVEERDKGRAVLLVSFELDELLSLSDRIAVLHNGAAADILPAAEASEARIGALMAGLPA